MSVVARKNSWGGSSRTCSTRREYYKRRLTRSKRNLKAKDQRRELQTGSCLR